MNDFYTYLTISAQTDIGRVREHNEDTIGFSSEFGWCCVADGMGGEQAGDVASQTTIDGLDSMLSSIPDERGADNLAKKRALIDQALLMANARIRTYVRENSMSQSGTTVAALAFDVSQPDKVLMVHAGDSRIYRLRGDALNQLTIDHSVAAAAGVESETDIPLLFRGVVTKAVGIKKVLEADYETIAIEPDDIYLICSDGLTGFVSDEKIASLLHEADRNQLDETTAALIAAANEGGGKDNISAILIHVKDVPEGSIGPLSPVETPDDDEVVQIRAAIAAHIAAEEDEEGNASNPSGDLFSSSRGLGLSDSFTHSTDSIASQPLPPETVEPSTHEISPIPEQMEIDVEAPGTTTIEAAPEPPQKNAFRTILNTLLGILILAVVAIVYVLLTQDSNDGETNPEITAAAPPAVEAPPPAVKPEVPPPAPVVAKPQDVEPEPETLPLPPAEPAIDPAELRAAQVEKLQTLQSESSNTGAWGALASFMEASELTLSDTTANAADIARTKKWIEIWRTLAADTEQAEAVYNGLYEHIRRMDEVGVEWDGMPIPDGGLAQNPTNRANQVCQVMQAFKTQAPSRLDALGNQLRNSLTLFTIDRRPVMPDLQTFYNITTRQEDLSALRTTIPEAQMANKRIMDFRRIALQSPDAFLSPSPTPDFSAPRFTKEVKNVLSGIEQVTQRAEFEQATKLFRAQLASGSLSESEQSTGEDLLKQVEEKFDALSLYRINHPEKPTDVPHWLKLEALALHQEHFKAVRAFILWNRDAFAGSESN
jgi:protein phosphatase